MDQTVMQKLSDGAAELPENKRRYGYGRGWVGKTGPAGSRAKREREAGKASGILLFMNIRGENFSEKAP